MTVSEFRSALFELLQEHDSSPVGVVSDTLVASISDPYLEALMLKVLACSSCGAEHEGAPLCHPCYRWSEA